MRASGDIGGPFWNGLQDELTAWMRETIGWLREEFTAGGHAPFTDPNSPREQYDRLIAAYMADDPRYWDNPNAQAALAKLSERFGPPPPKPVSPFGGVI